MTDTSQSAGLVALADRIDCWPIDHLRPSERNPRTHSAAQVEQIAASIVGFGWTKPDPDRRGRRYSGRPRPAAGRPQVIARRPDTVVGLRETRIHSETANFELRGSEVSSPRSGDQLTVGGDTFVIQGEPERRDPDRLVWTLDTRPI